MRNREEQDAHLIVQKLLLDLQTRSRFRGAWSAMDELARAQMVEQWDRIVLGALRNPMPHKLGQTYNDERHRYNCLTQHMTKEGELCLDGDRYPLILMGVAGNADLHTGTYGVRATLKAFFETSTGRRLKPVPDK